MGLTAGLGGCSRFLGMQGMHGTYASSMANKEADLVIGIGVRFSDRATGNAEKYASRAKVIHIDADFAEIGTTSLRAAGKVISRICVPAKA